MLESKGLTTILESRTSISLLLMVFIGCGNTYTLRKTSISGSRPFENGFIIEKIIVDSVHKQDEVEGYYLASDSNIRRKPAVKKGVPISFKIDTSVMLIPKYGESLRKIYFNKPNKGYYWECGEISDDRYHILPIKFLRSQWYHFGNLPGPLYDNAYHIYLHVMDDGTFEIFEDYKPGPY